MRVELGSGRGGSDLGWSWNARVLHHQILCPDLSQETWHGASLAYSGKKASALWELGLYFSGIIRGVQNTLYLAMPCPLPSMSPSLKETLVAAMAPEVSSGSHFDTSVALGTTGFWTELPIIYLFLLPKINLQAEYMVHFWLSSMLRFLARQKCTVLLYTFSWKYSWWEACPTFLEVITGLASQSRNCTARLLNDQKNTLASFSVLNYLFLSRWHENKYQCL